MAYARENLVRVPGSEEPLPVRVLEPVLLLAGKIRNALDIERDLPEKPRQDVKHVAILATTACRTFWKMCGTQVAVEAEQKQILTEYVVMLASLNNTYSSRRFEAQHRE